MTQVEDEHQCLKGNEKWLVVASSAGVEFVAVTITFVVVVVAAAVVVALDAAAAVDVAVAAP